MLINFVVSLCTCMLLTNTTKEEKLIVKEQKKQWRKHGCTILSDGWTDEKNHTIIKIMKATSKLQF
jgi:hypothetical protein